MCLGQKQLCGSPGTHPAWRQVHSKDLHSHLSMSAPVLSALSCLSSAGCPHCTFIIPRPFLSAALLFRQSFRINKCSFQTIYFLCLTQVLDYDAKVALNLWFSCLSFPSARDLRCIVICCHWWPMALYFCLIFLLWSESLTHQTRALLVSFTPRCFIFISNYLFTYLVYVEQWDHTLLHNIHVVVRGQLFSP